MTGWARRGVLAAIVAFATVAAPAQATVRKGNASDRQGDTAAGSRYDIVKTVAQADDTGRAGIGVQLAATPASGMYVVGLLGTTNGTSCGAPYVIFSGIPSSGVAVYGRDTAASSNDFKAASMSVDGGVVAFAAVDEAQLALPFDCAIAGTSQDAGGQDTYDETDALIALAPDAPPAPTPTPVVTPAPTPVLAPTTATTPPVAVPKAAKLTVTLEGAPATIRRNRSMTLKLRIANDGSQKSSKVTLSLSRPRGLSATKQIKLSALKPGQKRTLKLKVKLTKRARVSTTLKVTAKAGKQKAASSLLLRIGKAKKVNPKTTPEVKKSPIVGTYWWRNVNHVDYAWDNRALYFVDGGAVYSGFAAGGLPATCTTPPAKPDGEFDERDGCLAYTFDAKSGAVTIGDKAGTFKDGKLTIDGNEYNPLQIPAAGTRYTINEHEHTSFSGMCGFITGCTVGRQFLSLSPDGQFVLSRSTTSTSGDPGLGPWTAVGSYPPDQHGTYDVQAGGKIALTYADGSVKVETFAVEYNHDTGALDPVGEGLLIGADNFYPDPSP